MNETVGTCITPTELEKYRQQVAKIDSPIGLQGFYQSLPYNFREFPEIQQLVKDRRKQL